MEKDFVKNTILKGLQVSTTDKVAETYQLDLFTVASFEQVLRTGEVLDGTFTEYDMLHLYHQGITYSEISHLLGITKEGVRYNLKKTGNHLKNSLAEHKINRQKIKETILKERMEEALATSSRKEAAKQLGYSERYFDILYKEYEDEKNKEEKENKQ